MMMIMIFLRYRWSTKIVKFKCHIMCESKSLLHLLNSTKYRQSASDFIDYVN